jgi:hypothetical protein
MSNSLQINTPDLKNHCPWYEANDGTCRIKKPTIINMGEDRPAHLLFPINWEQCFNVLPHANNLASQNDAFLVFVLSGEISLEQMKSLIIKFADKGILPLWIGKENRNKFNNAVVELAKKYPYS